MMLLFLIQIQWVVGLESAGPWRSLSVFGMSSCTWKSVNLQGNLIKDMWHWAAYRFSCVFILYGVGILNPLGKCFGQIQPWNNSIGTSCHHSLEPVWRS